MESNRTITILGLPSFQAVTFNRHSGELTVTADVECAKVGYKNLPILHLFFDRFEEGVEVDEDYSRFVPYLKAIPAFRIYIRNWLLKFLEQNAYGEKEGIIRSGVETYLAEIHSFSDVKSLVRQAKSSVNSLSDQRKGAEQKARAVLAALNIIPHTDVGFELKVE